VKARSSAAIIMMRKHLSVAGWLSDPFWAIDQRIESRTTVLLRIAAKQYVVVLLSSKSGYATLCALLTDSQ